MNITASKETSVCLLGTNFVLLMNRTIINVPRGEIENQQRHHLQNSFLKKLSKTK